MEIITLANLGSRAGLGRAASPSTRPGKFAEVFARGDAAVQPFPDLMSAAYEIRMSHPRGADLILIGMSAVQGMKIIQDCWGVTVLIGLPPSSLAMFSPETGDEVRVAFDQGALRPAGVIGFLWDGGNAPTSGPPESKPTAVHSRLDSVHHLRRLNLA